MALEERNGNYYYYRKEREGNRVVSKYYGKGELAELMQQLDEMECEKKRFETLENLRNKQKIEAIDGEIECFENLVKELTVETLISLGFYKTSSREWRHKAK